MSQSSKTIWLYGDSFTEGQGTSLYYPEHPEYYKTYQRYFFGHYLRNKWYPEYGIVNRGKSGTSSQHSLLEAVRDTGSWKKDDIVILGCSPQGRIEVPYISKDGEFSYNPYGSMIVDINFMEEVKNIKGVDPEVVSGVHTFYKHSVVPNLAAWELHWHRSDQALVDLSAIALSMGCRTVVWDVKMWYLFENLATWSKKKLDDMHWSPNGNIQFAHLLRQCLEEHVTDITAPSDNPYASWWNKWKDNGVYEMLNDETIPNCLLNQDPDTGGEIFQPAKHPVYPKLYRDELKNELVGDRIKVNYNESISFSCRDWNKVKEGEEEK